MNFRINSNTAKKTITIDVQAALAACLLFHAFLDALRLKFPFTWKAKLNPDAETAKIDAECRPMWEVTQGRLPEGQIVCEQVVITPVAGQQEELARVIMQLVKKNVFPRVTVRK